MTDAGKNKNGLSASQLRGIYWTIGCVVCFIAVILVMFVTSINKPRIMTDSEMKNNGFYMFEKPRAFKPFSLIDDKGKEFTQERFLGKWSLVFFGFTYCPDICPTTLALLNRFYEQQQLKKFGEDLQIILVTVDPARDTPEKLHEYIKYFNPSFTGVAGEFLDIHRFATQVNIPFSKVPDGGENYTVEHSGNVVVINDKGHYIGFIRAPLDLAKLDMTYQSMRLTR